MRIVWDETKREINLAKHGLDFADLDAEFFGSAVIVPSYASRCIAIGYLNGAITVAFVYLGREALSVISMRTASNREREKAVSANKAFDPVHAADHGYSLDDWNAVDLPELTDEDLARAKPFAEVFPDLYASIVRSRAEREAARTLVSVRLDPDILDKLKASGPDWETRMNDALRRWVDKAA